MKRFFSKLARTLTVFTALAMMPNSSGLRAESILSNGDFSSYTGGYGQLGNTTSVTSWTPGGTESQFGTPGATPVFLYSPANLTAGEAGDGYFGTVKFYNGLPSNNITSITGNVIAADGDPSYAGSLAQSVTGLNIGDTYQLTFNWAGAQQTGYHLQTKEDWQVTFGGSTQSTSTVTTPSQSFIGWQSASMNFTATSTSEMLTFLAQGMQSGNSPWLLLNGASLVDSTPAVVPEPSSLVMMGLGIAGVVVSLRRCARGLAG